MQKNSTLAFNRFLPLACSLGAVVYLGIFINERAGLAAGIGIALGICLYHAAFGFTSAWRRFLTERWGAGLKAQVIMLAVVVTLFFPTLDSGHIWGQSVYGFVAPAGTGVIVGAFLFGIGMQIASGCASGTLFTVGGGSLRMVVTLFAFMMGSVLATLNLPFWHELPKLAPISMISLWGWKLALAFHLVLFWGLYQLVKKMEKKEEPSTGHLAEPETTGFLQRIVQGPWPLVLGAVGLAVLNFVMLATLGHPWGITSGITFWGGKLVTFLGADLSSVPYWSGQTEALQGSLFNNDASSSNIGIVLGAMSAAVLAGKFGKNQNLSARGIITALIGGVLLGYGARLAYGCNIGAFFSGVASGSLHGWVWLVAALAGNMVGIRVVKIFSLR
ncbi:YeeE/YedE family protein [Kiloniella laminariae]|uniref:YeeE/YedE family protein n=1 Tax=Kiloniella laminariae TaxID=454162 RepID=A0ABT4LNR7_9PROT|nr:YeeE/YedE family protein [Kiloniella laminariae]MCZ4282738.1 YeeE/YedE family protein [Kiloniella laminariae]